MLVIEELVGICRVLVTCLQDFASLLYGYMDMACEGTCTCMENACVDILVRLLQLLVQGRADVVQMKQQSGSS